MDKVQLSAISDQLSVDEAVHFIEAVKRANWRAQLERSERRLELAMRKAFREQGRVFVRGLSKFKNRFTEAVQIASPFGDDLKMLDESIPPTEWMFVFYESAKKTFGLFEKPIDTAAQEALKLGASHLIADIGMNFSFDLKNPRAVAYLDRYGAAHVTKINETTREYLNTIMTQSANDGWSYQRTAEAIIDRYAEFGVGKPQAHIDSRAHLIAVTETGNAYAEGNLMVARDLQEAGIGMEKAWSTVGDDKVSAECKANEEQGYIAINKPFASGHQRPLRFPGCRCDLLTRVADVENVFMRKGETLSGKAPTSSTSLNKVWKGDLNILGSQKDKADIENQLSAVLQRHDPRVLAHLPEINICTHDAAWFQACENSGISRKEAKNVLGFVSLSDNKLYMPWNSVLDGATLDHEIGHVAFFNSDTTKAWKDAWKDKAFDRHTEYAETNKDEGFAETYMAYMSSEDKESWESFKVIQQVLSGVK